MNIGQMEKSNTPATDSAVAQIGYNDASQVIELCRHLERLHRSMSNKLGNQAQKISDWKSSAYSAGLYRADEDVSTPEKWLSAQLRAYKRLKVPPFDREDGS